MVEFISVGQEQNSLAGTKKNRRQRTIVSVKTVWSVLSESSSN